uniref:Uncharacterized protein n=2 Tax=viral metagenome TaxID=1070528 RepID=A0A6H1ZGS7_9ZZZZ
MKKIFLIILFLSCGSVYAQQTWTDTTATGAETRKYVSAQSTAIKGPLPVDIYITSALVDSLTGRATTLTSAVKSISTASDTLVSASTACKWVSITNFTAGSTLYIGGSAVSAANGFPLLYLDSITFAIKNLTGVYVIGSTTISVRYLYGN